LTYRRATARDTTITLSRVTKWYEVPRRHIGGLRGLLMGRFGAAAATRRFKALDDVTLTIPAGRSVALIGDNGSGKSTLLKVIAGVTAADEGEATVPANLASLIELGAGFHPDLTGWENVFLQGRLFGRRDADIRPRLGEVAEFSGLGRFLDAPLKTYSSGMQARLGFTVATQFEPDVVLVDEVLSVGDAEFQARSFARICDYQRMGRTIVFVSHQLEVVEQICSHAVWLEEGRVRDEGETRDVLAAYRRATRRGPSIVGAALAGEWTATATATATGRRGGGEARDAGEEALAPASVGRASLAPDDLAVLPPVERLSFVRTGSNGAAAGDPAGDGRPATHHPAAISFEATLAEWPADARWCVRLRLPAGVAIDTLRGALAPAAADLAGTAAAASPGGPSSPTTRRVTLRFATLPLHADRVSLEVELSSSDKLLARSQAPVTFELAPEVARVANLVAQPLPRWTVRTTVATPDVSRVGAAAPSAG
jgi:lipopolysaccharide transport system ATP-binding protein